jgi:YcxB-like protein
VIGPKEKEWKSMLDPSGGIRAATSVMRSVFIPNLQCITVKLTYAIKIDDFRVLRPPFRLRAGSNAGFKGVLVACGLIALLGVFTLAQGMGVLVGGFLIGLGAVSATVAYFYEQRSVRTKREAHEKSISEAFRQIHCRDQRVFAVDENGFTVSCGCSTVTRPWSGLASFSESDTHFAFGTNAGGQILPKSAFSSEAQITEFRAFVSGKLNQDKSVASPHIDFTCTPVDYRAACWLHILKGGGWRHLGKTLATSAFATWGCIAIWRYVSASRDPVVLVGLIALLVGAPLFGRVMRSRQKTYPGRLRVYFDDEGLHAQYPATQSRRPWSQFIGYLEDKNVMLLYLSPTFRTVIPKRALTGQGLRLQTLIKAKLARHDYRNPIRPLEAKLASSPQQAS